MEAKGSSGFRTAAQIVGFGAGGAVYVYLVGGGFLYVQLWTAGLSPDTGLSDFSNRELLTKGVPILFGGVPLTAMLTLAAHYLWRLIYRSTHHGQPPNGGAPSGDDGPVAEKDAQSDAGGSKDWNRDARRGTAAAVIAVLAAVGLDAVVAESVADLLAAASIAGVASVGSLVALPLLLGRRLPDPTRPGAIIWLIAAASLATLFGAAYVAWTDELKLPVATVMLTDGSCLRGGLIAVDSSGVYLADGRTKQITTLPSDRVALVTSGPDTAISTIRIASAPCQSIGA
jgi:hypothetical protein